MTELGNVEQALASSVRTLRTTGKAFALVGGLAVSVRAEVRFTRDVDWVVAVVDDLESEALVFTLRQQGYTPVASVEHDARARLATVRLMSPHGVKVDLLFASSGIEREISERALDVELPGAGAVPVARSEELLAMKVLSMTEVRIKDRMDALNLLKLNPKLDLDSVRANLRLIAERGFDREEPLDAKLDSLLHLLGR